MKESHRMILQRIVASVLCDTYTSSGLQQVNHCNTINRQKFGFITKPFAVLMRCCTRVPLWIEITIHRCYRAIELIEISFTCAFCSISSGVTCKPTHINTKPSYSYSVLCNGDSVVLMQPKQQQQRRRRQHIITNCEAIVSVVVVVVIVRNTPKSIIGTVNHHNFTIMHILLPISELFPSRFISNALRIVDDDDDDEVECVRLLHEHRKNWTIERLESRMGYKTPDKRMIRGAREWAITKAQWKRLNETEIIIIKRAYHSNRKRHTDT